MKETNEASYEVTYLLVFLSVWACEQYDGESERQICTLYLESQAEFPGGYDSMKTFIRRNTRYPSPRTCVEGNVFVQFIVNEDGSVTDAKVIRGLCEQCDRNALLVISKMPKWMPARENGKFLKSKLIIPIKF